MCLFVHKPAKLEDPKFGYQILDQCQDGLLLERSKVTISAASHLDLHCSCMYKCTCTGLQVEVEIFLLNAYIYLQRH